MKKDIVNQFSVSGFIGQDATVRDLVTCEGYFKPETWTAEDGTARNRVILVAVKFFATPDKDETNEEGK